MITHKAMLVDITLCIGCNSCQDACKRQNNLPGGTETKLSPTAFTALEDHDGITVRRMCQHCEVPACASVCPVEALNKTAEGPVVYDEGKCIGCRYCMQACPFQVPRYEWGSTHPRMRKCRFCYERVKDGMQTACAEICPTGATKFGNRDDLIREAFSRIQAEPDKYVNRLYGQNEVGGTSILYLTSVPFEQLGFKTHLRTEALPELTMNALSKVTSVATISAVCLSGIYWITRRREAVECAERNRMTDAGKRSVPSRARPSAKPRTARFTFWKCLAAIILAAGAYSAFVRFASGLGTATNLSDMHPWGLWIGLDVLCGVGLAAGGFTIAALVHVFNLERFEPIMRPAILTAFLGYLLVIVALIFDLGRPWAMWHAIIMWNPHSVMSEVAWCVMLYTSVLAIESLPAALEKSRASRTSRILGRVWILIVILGVILSTLHQSLLGALFLIVPDKLDKLWYSPYLPLFFLVSALATGCAVVILESSLSGRVFNWGLDRRILEDLAKMAVVFLLGYLFVRILDGYHRHIFALLFVPRMETYLYWFEIVVGVLAPILILSHAKLRRRENGLCAGAAMIVIGFITGRLNVTLTGMQASAGTFYFPSWMEVSITLGMLTIGFIAFVMAAKYMPIYAHGGREAVEVPPEV